MDVSIVGASGGCGREIVTQIVQQRLLESREILQLVGSNPNSRRPHLLHGFRADLQDAYAEIIPELNVTDEPAAIIGDGGRYYRRPDLFHHARGNRQGLPRHPRPGQRPRPLSGLPVPWPNIAAAFRRW